jgi:ROK family
VLLVEIADLVVRALEEASQAAAKKGDPPYTLGEVRAVGVGLPFPITPEGMIVGAFAPGLSGLPLPEVLEQALRDLAEKRGESLHPRLRTRFAKDGDLGALALWREQRQSRRRAEAKARTAGEDVQRRHTPSFVFVKASYGIDAAIVCHDRLVAGDRGLGGQLGHMWVPRLEGKLASTAYDPPAGIPEPGALISVTEQCPRCGRVNCLENVASGRAIVRQIGLLRDGAQPASTVKELIEQITRAQTTHQQARSIVMQAAAITGVVIADAVRLADPSRIVVGGLLALAGETYLEPLRTALAESSLPGLVPRVQGVPPERVTQLELEGAIALALRHM